jgi:hypothetical protein
LAFERSAAGFGDKGRSQMSKVYAGLLVVAALIATAAIGTLSLVVVTDVGFVAYRLLKPGKYPWRGADRSKDDALRVNSFAVLRSNLENG